MTREGAIQILVDDFNDTDRQHAFDLGGQFSKAARVVSADPETLKAGLSQLISSIMAALPTESLQSDGFELSEVTFNVAVDASGSVSLVSVLSGTTSGRVGIEFTLRRNE